MKKLLSVLLLACVFLTAVAQETDTDKKVQAAMASDSRSEADVARDRNRKPVETLAFFQFREDMRVLELIPGGGWYTRLLASALRENGELYVSIWTNTVAERLLSQDEFSHVTVLDIDAEIVRDGAFRTNTIDPFSFGVNDMDLVVTFRNMHNLTPQGRAAINTATYDALKSGGLYGVIDHTRRHMAPLTYEARRRADPVEIIKEVLDAGFVLEAYSDLHYRPDDELRYEVGRRTVTGNTDRFTLLFRKP
ncbi:MAG: class I SAM-dependent methyltransferase [Proteobacteria bacterium]|nr:class I SAM-dependent methyltransferase [Pseudomonadota bacterium]